MNGFVRRIFNRPRTIAGKFLMIVVLGAVLPLVLVGLWLTHSAKRSGAALLDEQLGSAADVIVASIEHRWALRDGELQLLAGNTSARNALTSTASARDSLYLAELASTVGDAIPSFSYVDVNGHERWSFAAGNHRLAADSSASRPQSYAFDQAGRGSAESLGKLLVEVPIAPDGQAIGRLVASVQLASFLPTDSTHFVVPGLVATIADSHGSLWSSSPASLTLPTGSERSDMQIVRRSLEHPKLQLTVAAPSAPYVRPFENAARIGLGVLAVVAFVALALSVVLTSQVTRSLQRLSEGARAVADGNLERTVDRESDDEIGRLAVAFNDMTESLRRTVAELAQQRALAAVGEFAASLSHEVRNSLTAIRVDLQHVTRHLPGDAPATSLVVRALGSVRRLDSTVTSALRVARSGQASSERVDLRLVLTRAIHSTEPSFVERCATLTPIAGDFPIEIVGDAAALEQLFVNVLLNAAQAMSVGGRATLDVSTEDANVSVRIADTGVGIAAERLHTLGAPYQTTKPYGTGLGLPIARRIASAHGGELLVESEAGSGTTVIVRLPVAS